MNIIYQVLFTHSPSVSVDKSVNNLCITIMEYFLQRYRYTSTTPSEYYSTKIIFLNIKAYIVAEKVSSCYFPNLGFLGFALKPIALNLVARLVSTAGV